MNKKLLFTLFVAFSVLLLPTAFAEGVCPQSVHDLAASCPGGTLTSDTVAGSCRSLVCEDSFGTDLSVLACDKPGTPADFFEMYQLSSGSSGVQSCLGDTCLNPSVSGFVKSDDFDTCDEPPVDPVCGNDVVEGDEECDGSAPEGYMCTETCELEEVVDEPADDVCLESVFDAEVSCDGIITEDVDAGGCRKVSCGLGGDSFTALACDKPISENPMYFEMYTITSIGNPNFELCFGATCMNPFSSGFVKSEDFEVCEEPACDIKSVFDMTAHCADLPSMDDCEADDPPFYSDDRFSTYEKEVDGQTCLGFSLTHGSHTDTSTLSAYACDDLENPNHFTITVEDSTGIHFGTTSGVPGHAFCLDGKCVDFNDYLRSVSFNYCDDRPVCGNSIVEAGEQCDDGNTVTGDGCSRLCRYDFTTFDVVSGYYENGITGDITSFEDGDIVEVPIEDIGSGILGVILKAQSKDDERDPYRFIYRTHLDAPGVRLYSVGSSEIDASAPARSTYSAFDLASGPASMIVDALRGNDELGELAFTIDVLGDVCYGSVRDIPVHCTGDYQVLLDSWDGCRTVICSTPDVSEKHEVKACDKPGSHDVQYFEMYTIEQTNPIEVCFAEDCISNQGFKISEHFAVCE